MIRRKYLFLILFGFMATLAQSGFGMEQNEEQDLQPERVFADLGDFIARQNNAPSEPDKLLIDELKKENSDLETIKILVLEKGAHPNFKCNLCETAFTILLEKKNPNIEIIKFLYEQGVDFDKEDFAGATPFWNLCANKENPPLEIFKLLLDKGVDPNKAINIFGFTPLHKACEFQNREIISLLLDKGANPNIQDKDRDTSLYYACFNKGPKGEIIILLLNKGANPYLQNKNGNTILHVASKKAIEDKSVEEVFVAIINYFEQMRPSTVKVKYLVEVANDKKFAQHALTFFMICKRYAQNGQKLPRFIIFEILSWLGHNQALLRLLEMKNNNQETALMGAQPNIITLFEPYVQDDKK